MSEVEWSFLEPHLPRGALILVNLSLKLSDVAQAVIADDKTEVSNWIQNGLLTKPTPEQIQTWASQPHHRFSCVIAQPYVLFQEARTH